MNGNGNTGSEELAELIRDAEAALQTATTMPLNRPADSVVAEIERAVASTRGAAGFGVLPKLN